MMMDSDVSFHSVPVRRTGRGVPVGRALAMISAIESFHTFAAARASAGNA
jgi:hypothetical protein